MNTFRKIELQKAVVHLVGRDRYQLSDRELPLGTNRDVIEFLVSRLRQGLEDRSARKARFDEERPQVVRRATAFAIEGRRRFLAASRTIADHLNEIIQSDKRISGATLMVCLFALAEWTTTYPWMGILKMDPSRVFRPVVRKDKYGSRFVTFETVSNALPAYEDRLQKCAFLCPPGEGDFDLIILDRQRAVGDEAARFFTESFLGAELYPDERLVTRRFYEGVLRACGKFRDEISERAAEEVRDSLDDIAQTEELHVDRWIDEAPLPARVKKAVRNEIEKDFPGPTITVDPETARRLVSKRKYRGDDGFSLTFATGPGEAIFIGKPDTIQDPVQGDLTRLVLRVQNFHEVVAPVHVVSSSRVDGDADTDRSPLEELQLWYPEPDLAPTEGIPFELGVELPFAANKKSRRDQLDLLLSLTSRHADVSPETRSLTVSRLSRSRPIYYEITPRSSGEIILSLALYLRKEAMFLAEYDISVTVQPDRF